MLGLKVMNLDSKGVTQRKRFVLEKWSSPVNPLDRSVPIYQAIVAFLQGDEYRPTV